MGNPEFPDNYIFNIISPEDTPEEQRNKIKQKNRLINKYMKRIAEKTGIDKGITTYWARHSFSTILKQSGASIEYISKALGHHNLQTTESYLDSFADDTKLEFAKKLVPKRNE